MQADVVEQLSELIHQGSAVGDGAFLPAEIAAVFDEKCIQKAAHRRKMVALSQSGLVEDGATDLVDLRIVCPRDEVGELEIYMIAHFQQTEIELLRSRKQLGKVDVQKVPQALFG